MDWIYIASTIAGGLLLVCIEFFIFPGITVAGLLGLALLIVGIILGFFTYGITIGTYILLFALISTAILLYVGYKQIGSKGWALTYRLDKQNPTEITAALPEIGSKGVAHGDLRPEGKVLINEKEYYAHSSSGFINDRAEIVVTKIEQNMLMVKLL